MNSTQTNAPEPKKGDDRPSALKKANKAKGKAGIKMKSSDLKMRNVKYYIIETFRSLAHNKIMTITSIATVAACLLIVTFSYAIASNVNHILAYLENTIGVAAFIYEDLSSSQIELLYGQILQISNVVAATFVSPEEALQNMAESLGDTQNILLSLGYPNPLRPSFELEMLDISLQAQTVAEVGALYGVANVREVAQLTNAVVTFNNFVGVFSFLIIFILGVLAVVIITNTIKLTVNSRRNEILIMRYIGATEWFIKWPFMMEGIIIGVLGALIPLGLVWFSYDGAISAIRDSEVGLLLEIPFLEAGDIFPLFVPFTIIIGAIIGALGSISSMRKYLSV